MAKNPCESCTYFQMADSQIELTDQITASIIPDFARGMEVSAAFDENRKTAQELGIDYDSLPTSGVREQVLGMRGAIDKMGEAVLSANESKADAAQKFKDTASKECEGPKKYGILRPIRVCTIAKEHRQQLLTGLGVPSDLEY